MKFQAMVPLLVGVIWTLGGCSGGVAPATSAATGNSGMARASTTRPTIVGQGRMSQAEIQIKGEIQIKAGPGITEAETTQLRRYLVRGRQRVEAFFERPFAAPFTVFLFARRADLDRFWRKKWNMPGFKSRCWMVASGTEDSLSLLVPGAWRKQACDHDPARPTHVQNLITHELVHVYHDQFNPAVAFEGFEPMSWFVEGLATHVSGQLQEGYLASPAEALRLGRGPTSLAKAWSGKYRYGVCGTMVKFLQTRGGKALLINLLKTTSSAQLHELIGLNEQQLLAQWRSWMVKQK